MDSLPKPVLESSTTPYYDTFGPHSPVGSRSPEPHLEDGSTYHPLRPNIPNQTNYLHPPVRRGSVAKPSSHVRFYKHVHMFL